VALIAAQIVLGREAAAMDVLRAQGSEDLPDVTVLWTDQRSDLFSVLR
jgi:hypothetical protein